MESLDFFIFSGVRGRPASRDLKSIAVFPVFLAALSEPKPALFRLGRHVGFHQRRIIAQLSTLGRVPQRVLKSVKPFASRFGLLKYQSVALVPDCEPNMSVIALFWALIADAAFVLSFIPEPFQAAEGANQFFQVGIALGRRHSGDALEAVLAVHDLELGDDDGEGGFAVVEPADIPLFGKLHGVDAVV